MRINHLAPQNKSIMHSKRRATLPCERSTKRVLNASRTLQVLGALLLYAASTGCISKIYSGDYYVPQGAKSSHPVELYEPYYTFLGDDHEVGSDLQGGRVKVLGGEIQLIGEYRCKRLFLVGVIVPYPVIPTFGYSLREEGRKILLRVLMTGGLTLDQNTVFLQLPGGRQAGIDWIYHPVPPSLENLYETPTEAYVGTHEAEFPISYFRFLFDARYGDVSEFVLVMDVHNSQGESEQVRVQFDRSNGYFYDAGYFHDSRQKIPYKYRDLPRSE